jgi:uncharacterized Zn finger protein
MNLFDITTADKAIDRAMSSRPIKMIDHGGGEFEVQGKGGRYTVNVQVVGERIYYSCSCPARTLCKHVIQPIAMMQVRMKEQVEVMK